MLRKEFIGICLVLVVGIAAAVFTGMSEKKAVVSGHDHGHGHGHGRDHGHDHDADVGPNGGKILKEDPFRLELVIYEKGTPPHFRVYASNDSKPVDPQEVTLAIELERLGDKVTVFHFKPGPGYLFCAQEVDEPHSFFVKVLAEWKGQKFDWQYSQYEGRLTLPPELAQKIGIESATAGPGTIKSLKQLPGEIALNEDRLSHVVPRVPGVVLESRKNLGDHVSEGDILAIIDSRELGEARSRYLVALEREKLAKYNFERAQSLWERQVVPEKEFLTTQKAFLEEKIELAAARRKLMTLGLSEKDVSELADGSLKNLTHFMIRAAFDGVIVSKHLSPGEWVKEDAEIFVIADLSEVWVEITVYEKDMESVYIGQEARIRNGSSDMEAVGKVSYIGPLVGEQSRTAKARVVVPNPEGRWRPGRFVKVHLVREEISAPVAVPNEAIQSFRNWSVVFFQHDDQYEVRPLELGRTDGKLTAVRKGLSPGERYVTRNSFILKAELGKAGIAHEH
ncbi:MAG: efflux RND transporter periplasmic adaptor subunit [Deltaproteobacteria bacterium]|nr:efflux RND transporter periplasmic adaptor subunit [Deltaproteobacteria bacterium]